jgi:putative membrane protein
MTMMWWDGGWSWWGWTLMTLVILASWGALAWVVVGVIRDNRTKDARHGEDGSPTASAEQILAERYARGEIDAAEYHQRLDRLRNHESPVP